ncbi:MFS transporter [Paraburkholderia phenoliruptrix]|uniref:MFS transporter n=1 Tax=Paraburkholderia phenoliruptrix TaxID=252970 RepID=UPI002863307D|nr:MFS transporter [Paraburkholderia phenoliruptrix]MDR6391457.1 MFS family permease [Paraburkholderia phenoliruptrix]WMY11721.1 MFS transporter [Paraburkholderia phenoliruptrix]
MRKFFYGWVIAAASGLGIGCGVSVFIPSTLGLLVGPLGKEMGWTPQALFLCPLFAAIATVFVATPVGALVDKYGVRRMIAFGFLAQAAITASFYFLGTDIAGLYARYALFAILGTATTAVAFTRLVSAWFERDRGLALGIALAGTGVGGAIWSLLAQHFILRHGWRVAFLWDSGVMLLVLCVLLAVVRETPKSMGLSVDGSAISATPNALRPSAGMTLGEASRTRAYWFMIVAFVIVVSSVYAVMLHLVPMLRQRGVSAQTAAAIQASLWMAVVFGRVVTGWLMDRIFAPYVAAAFLVPSAVGMGLLATGATGGQAVVAAMMVGAAAGAEIDVVAYLCGRYFGLRHYGRIYGSLFAVAALGTAIGPALAAQLLPLAGGYMGVLWFEAALVVVGFILFLQFPRFDSQRSIEQMQRGRAEVVDSRG